MSRLRKSFGFTALGAKFLLFLLLASLACRAEAADEESTLIRVRGDIAYPPFDYYDAMGRPQGYDIEMLKAVGEVMGLKFELALGNWATIRDELDRGQIDLITGMFHVKAREATLAFSEPTLISTYGVFVRRDSDIKSFEDAKGRVLFAQRRDFAHETIEARQFASKLITVEGPKEALLLLAAGKGDAAIVPRLSGHYVLNKFQLDNVKQVGAPIFPQEYAFAVRKENTKLLARLNEGLAILKSTGRAQEIYKKWFGVYEEQEWLEHSLNLLAWILLPLLLLIGLGTAWLWTLKRTVAERTRELRLEIEKTKQAEAAALENERRYRLIFNQAVEAVFILENGLHIDCNRRTLDLYGAPPEAFIGKSPLIIAPEFQPDGVSSKEKAEKYIRAALEGREQRFYWQHKRLDDGRLFDGEVSLVRFDFQGHTFLQARVHDISARRAAEERLLQTNRMEAIGRLVGGVAHDFNNLLTAISGNAELALINPTLNDSRLRVNLQEIQKATERAAGLIRQLLAFSRRQLIEPRILDVNLLILNLRRMLERIIGEDIDLRTELRPELGPVNADPGQLEQILVNLVVNARDAMPDGGVLTILSDEIVLTEHQELPAGRYISLSVQDTGSGIPPEVLGRIFEPFFTTKSKEHGTGLGLATVFGIARQHDGAVEVQSEEGKGSRFTVYLPRVEAEVQPAEKQKIERELPLGSERILLVEDDPLVRDIAIKLLEYLGYSVRCAQNGQEALALFESEKDAFDLLVTDVIMPGMNGRELAERVWAIRPEIKVLFASGYTDDAIAHQGILESGLHFLSKPYSPEVLARKLRHVLDEIPPNN